MNSVIVVPLDIPMSTLLIAHKFYRPFHTMATASVKSPWHAAYPAPRITAATIRREDVLNMIKQNTEASIRDYILIDLRRNDFEVCNADHYYTLPFRKLSTVGRHHPRFNQPSRAELVPYPTNLIQVV